jgi:hypothetical protein
MDLSPLACTNSEIISETVNPLDICYGALDGGSAHGKTYSYTRQYKRKYRTSVQSRMVIEPTSVGAFEDSMNLRPRRQCDWHQQIFIE